jgi:Mg-chelatase subunit ChlI
MALAFPFSAIVGQDEMKQAILMTSIDPTIGGVLVFGHRGTGKSTAVRGLAALLPKMKAVIGCAYQCDPASAPSGCEQCGALKGGKSNHSHLVQVPVVDMPLGATEDRVVGALDLERALTQGIKAFEPGLLARANRGFLYIDEVNLLEDHLVDLLIDVAASGENVVEREGLSVRHPARFVLVGSGNPEEGELRPQLLDRFGLSVEVTTRRLGLAGRSGATSQRIRAQPGRFHGLLEKRRRPDPTQAGQSPRPPEVGHRAGRNAQSGCTPLHGVGHRRSARRVDTDASRACVGSAGGPGEG